MTERDFTILPLEQAETIPSTWYSDPEIFALESNIIFDRTWQYVGMSNRLQATGDRILAQVGSEPVVIVRGKDNRIRAFYNVCRHRGGPLASEDGCSNMLQCQYHGWTYALDGVLRGVPDFDRVELFDKKDFGLVPIEIAEYHGMLFIALEKPREDLATLLAGVHERIRNVELSELQYHSRVTYQLNCNWKIYVDNYLEGYHVPIVHPELFRMYDFTDYITETRERYSYQHSPLSASETLYSEHLRPGRAREALYFWIWPNLMLNLLPGRLQTNLVRPLSPNRCEVVFDYYYEDVTSERANKFIKEDLAFSELVQAEDIHICELVQRGVSSRSYDRGRFSTKRENAVHHFQSLLKTSLAQSLDRRG
jgi:phenylpropionate dioxygenase-like ring-hydroxylating dioxygenase large terminal subunit